MSGPYIIWGRDLMLKVLRFMVLVLPLMSVSPALGQDASSTVTQEDFFSTTLNRTYQYKLYLPA